MTHQPENYSSAAREAILGQLRSAITGKLPFAHAQATRTSLPVTNIGSDRRELIERFKIEVERVHGAVYLADNDEAAKRILLDLLAQRNVRNVTHWEDLPLELDQALVNASISTLTGDMRDVVEADAGITAAECAIAATGTLVLEMGPGRARATSLLVPVHIALVRVDQLVPRLEDYIARVRADHLQVFADTSNVVFITGASRTADIEMSVVYGVHGPLELHIVLIK